MRSAAAAFETGWAPSAFVSGCPQCKGTREAARVPQAAIPGNHDSRGTLVHTWSTDLRHQDRGRVSRRSCCTPVFSRVFPACENPISMTGFQASSKRKSAGRASRARVEGTLEESAFLPRSHLRGLGLGRASKDLGRRPSRRSWRIHAAAASSDGRNYYELLGVPQSADEREIKKAYRKMALKYHPDVNKEKDAEAVFVKIKQAYTTLSDSKSRSQYDMQLRGGWGFPSGGSSDWDPLDPFGYKKKKPKGGKLEEDEFYGLGEFVLEVSQDVIQLGRRTGEFFSDLQKEVEGWQKDRAASKAPKSLWEEMAEVGEEFVEFLEQELGLDEKESKKRTDQRTGGSPSNGSGSQARSQQKVGKERAGDGVGAGGTKYPKDEKEKASEIDDLLASLKKEMGL